MAILLLVKIPGVTQSQMDAVMRTLDLGGKSPPGQLFHVEATDAEGATVVDVWESREAFERFLRGKLGEAFRATNFPQPQVTFFEAHNLLTP